MILSSSIVLSQQNLQSELSGTNSQLFELIHNGASTEYTIEEAEETANEEKISGSKGFMPADDYENSLNRTGVISFTLLNPGFVSIKIYDNTGKSIDEIAKSSFGAGDHEVKWNRSKFSNGSFYYSIITSEFSKTEKIK